MNEPVIVGVQRELFACEVRRRSGGVSLVEEPLPLDLITGLLGDRLPLSVHALKIASYTPARSAAERQAERADLLERDGFALCVRDATTKQPTPFAFGLRRANHVRGLAFVRMYTDGPHPDGDVDRLLANIARLGVHFDLRVRPGDPALEEHIKLEDQGQMAEVLFHS